MRRYDKNNLHDHYSGVDPSTTTTTTTVVDDDDDESEAVGTKNASASESPAQEESVSSERAATEAASPKPIPMPEGPYVPVDRADMLQRNLVIKRRRDKGIESDHEDLPEEPKKTTGQKISKWADRGNLLLGAVFDGEKLTKDVIELSGNKMNEGVEKGFGIASMANSGISMINSIYKTRNNFKKAAKAKNDQKMRQSTYAAMGGVSSVISQAMSITSSGIKNFGDKKDADQKYATNVLGMLSSGLGVMGSAFSLASTLSGRKENKRIAAESGRFAREAREEDSFNPNYAANLSRDIKDDKKASRRSALRQERTDYKAKKYAMGMAQELNAMKGSQAVKGGFGMAKSILGAVTSLTKTTTAGTGFWNTAGGKATNLVLDGVSTLLKYAGKAHDKSVDAAAAMESNDKKLKLVDSYLSDKLSRLQISTDEMFADVPQEERGDLGSNELSEQEKKRVVIARLGLDIKITDEELSDEEKLNAFKLLAIRRARNILKASGETKRAMLNVLALDDSASESDIVKAMTGE
ncbi:MAG: hypothetical protein J6Y20_13640 [Lachnospiraceae bacterium]|nr:hypothetical protein [Lachnospiraceae bacterium]